MQWQMGDGHTQFCTREQNMSRHLSLGLVEQGPLAHTREATVTVPVHEAQALVGRGA